MVGAYIKLKNNIFQFGVLSLSCLDLTFVIFCVQFILCVKIVGFFEKGVLMKRLQVVFGEMTLDEALASGLKAYVYAYDPETMSPAPGNILQVRCYGVLENVTVVRLGTGDYKGPASPILRMVALAAREELIPESPELQQEPEFTQTSRLNNTPDDQAKQPKKINCIGLAQQMAVLAALQKQREAGNRYETLETLAKVIEEIVGFKFTRGNLDGMRKEMLALPPEQGGFDVALELLVSKTPRAKAEPGQLKSRLAAVEKAMEELPGIIAKLQDQVTNLTRANTQERGKLE